MDRITSSLASIVARLRELYAAQTMTNRLLAGGFLALVVIGIGLFAAFRLKGPEYGVLFSNLSSDEANAVVTKLQAEGVPHRLANNGTTVMIPMEKVADERVALAGTGVVKGGSTGFELFDRTNLGMTDFQEKIAKVRATEGELQRTISSLTPVESARVHIAVPEQSLYSSTQSPTTASIAVKTKAGMQLSPDEVRGITALTTGAVENLKPENVTIVNQDGNVLVPSPVGDPNNPLTAAASALKLTQDQLLAKQRWEANLQSNIQGLLDDAIGSKRSAVRVAADMNFDAASTESHTYGQGQVLSEQRERESANGIGGTRNAAAGVPGTTTNNVSTYQAAPPQQANARFNRSKATVNYKVPEQKVTHVDAPGKVTRLSVAVLVNVPTGAVPAAAGPNGTPTYTVAAADVAKIRNVVAAAAGLDPARGDQVSVEAIPFAPAPGSGVRTVTTVGGIPLSVLIVVGIVLIVVGGGIAYGMRRRQAVASASMAGAELPTFDSTLAEELPSFEEHPMLDGLTPSLAAPIRSAADLTREQMIEYVTTVAQENPDSIAKLIKLWLAEA